MWIIEGVVSWLGVVVSVYYGFVVCFYFGVEWFIEFNDYFFVVFFVVEVNWSVNGIEK